jgi:hypothetical protein
MENKNTSKFPQNETQKNITNQTSCRDNIDKNSTMMSIKNMFNLNNENNKSKISKNTFNNSFYKSSQESNKEDFQNNFGSYIPRTLSNQQLKNEKYLNNKNFPSKANVCKGNPNSFKNYIPPNSSPIFQYYASSQGTGQDLGSSLENGNSLGYLGGRDSPQSIGFNYSPSQIFNNNSHGNGSGSGYLKLRSDKNMGNGFSIDSENDEDKFKNLDFKLPLDDLCTIEFDDGNFNVNFAEDKETIVNKLNEIKNKKNNNDKKNIDNININSVNNINRNEGIGKDANSYNDTYIDFKNINNGENSSNLPIKSVMEKLRMMKSRETEEELDDKNKNQTNNENDNIISKKSSDSQGLLNKGIEGDNYDINQNLSHDFKMRFETELDKTDDNHSFEDKSKSNSILNDKKINENENKNEEKENINFYKDGNLNEKTDDNQLMNNQNININKFNNFTNQDKTEIRSNEINQELNNTNNNNINFNNNPNSNFNNNIMNNNNYLYYHNFNKNKTFNNKYNNIISQSPLDYYMNNNQMYYYNKPQNMNPIMMNHPFNIINNNNNAFKNNFNTYNNNNCQFPPGMTTQFNFDNMSNNPIYNNYFQSSGNINIQNNYFMYKNQDNLNNKSQDNTSKKNEKNTSNEKPKKKKKRKQKRLDTSSFINKPLSYFADNIIVCAKDQGASRYLQQLLDNNPKEIADFLFTPLSKNALKLINDPFGNYLLQKIITYLNQDQLLKILTIISPSFYEISCNSHGTRVLQKLIGYLQSPTIKNNFYELVKPIVVPLLKDINGTYIVQKFATQNLNDYGAKINAIIIENSSDLCTHRHGCCVIQKYLETRDQSMLPALIDKLIEDSLLLIIDQFGNYVIQTILLMGDKKYGNKLAEKISSNIVFYAKHKYSSNVVEKCFDYCDGIYLKNLINNVQMKENLINLMLDEHGNYVVQKVLSLCNLKKQKAMLSIIKTIFDKLKNLPYGERIINRIVSTYLFINDL